MGTQDFLKNPSGAPMPSTLHEWGVGSGMRNKETEVKFVAEWIDFSDEEGCPVFQLMNLSWRRADS